MKKTDICISIIIILIMFGAIFYLANKNAKEFMTLPDCQVEKYYIGKGDNEFINGEYEIKDGCLYFNNRVSCGKYTIIDRENRITRCK